MPFLSVYTVCARELSPFMFTDKTQHNKNTCRYHITGVVSDEISEEKAGLHIKGFRQIAELFKRCLSLLDWTTRVFFFKSLNKMLNLQPTTVSLHLCFVDKVISITFITSAPRRGGRYDQTFEVHDNDTYYSLAIVTLNRVFISTFLIHLKYNSHHQFQYNKLTLA